MYGTEAQRGTGNAAQSLRTVLRALQEEEAPADGLTPRAPEHRASVGDDPLAGDSLAEGVPSAADGRREIPPGGAPDLDLAWAAPERRSVTAQLRRRLPWVLTALALHGVLLVLFLLPQREPLPVTPPEPIQVQIITEPHVTPAPPPLKPISLTHPPQQVVVPAPLVAISNPAAISATTQPTPTAAVAVAPSNAPPAPAQPISPPQFDAAYLHNPAPQYPLQARRLREQGTVVLRVEVSAVGGALEVLIEHSSGWRILDDAAASAVKRWRFEAARQGRDPVAAWVLVPIEFDLRS